MPSDPELFHCWVCKRLLASPGFCYVCLMRQDILIRQLAKQDAMEVYNEPSPDTEE